MGRIWWKYKIDVVRHNGHVKEEGVYGRDEGVYKGEEEDYSIIV